MGGIRIEHLSLWDALFIGGAQVLALIPGTSRSGITMTAGSSWVGTCRGGAILFAVHSTILGAGVLGGLGKSV